MTTPYQSQYFAYELTRQHSSRSIGRLSQSLINATVDLNPHQVEAALFAFRAPLERGAILADEVGLGKTIEAGLIISQLWAERKRNILIIVPPPLRKQWNQELWEKFYISSIILESKNFNEMVQSGQRNPFLQQDQIVITSYQYARNKADMLRKVAWDLIVFDEAHRMRNVYKKSNKIGRALRTATAGCPKVLLTATLLQNSLMELYGLISFIDPHIFGDETTFRRQFARGAKEMSDADFLDLKRRIKPVCHRTLRRQVTEYVNYTQRIPITQEFMPTNNEWELYEKVSTYLQREQLFALPTSQRALMTLVVRKLLASSSFAISDTLYSLIQRLEQLLKDLERGKLETAAECSDVYEDVDEFSETVEEWEEEEQPIHNGLSFSEMKQLVLQEKQELEQYYELAKSIRENSKAEALLIALEKGFEKLKMIGANEKAVIFTESRRTQAYLCEFLERNGYAGKIVLFNGKNGDEQSKQIYAQWLEKHQHSDKITGSKTADMRAALVEYFKEQASIMIATESASEGINLQFCSLVVNYDLPWNPQRIEQRIGRCHRYGQTHDVVVINFLNHKNEADKKVYEILSEKFRLFEGVFGSSGEVLGALESGVDFEKRIQQIYQTCRTAEEIEQAFKQLQAELDEQIQLKMKETRMHLLENFDDEVREKLRDHYHQTNLHLNRMERYLWGLSKYEGAKEAIFDDETLSFTKDDETYQMISQAKKQDRSNVHHYRFSHPLAQKWIEQAKSRQLIPKEITFRYSDYEGKVTILEQLIGKEGWLSLDLLHVQSLENEQHFIFSAIDLEGEQLDQEICEKMFELPAVEGEEIELSESIGNTLRRISKAQQQSILNDIMERTSTYLDAELEKLEKWSQDLKNKLEKDIDEMTVEIEHLKREAKLIRNLAEKLEMNKQIKELEKKRNDMRRSLYDQQDEIDEQKDRLFEEIEKKLEQRTATEHLFTIKWRIV
ncbi:DEAD/DEAH box helicase [Anoxybacillus gonensis]|uniref:SNF2-related protein n=1 Tax=Anoxybacillus gonensis TaxID=198467 RepID=A0AAW7TIH8_9BACL|nr:SNF2-related protein [Anoxybacillus gonensis]AKS38126.1 DEAD/DEAH box helicase [Anoxybacillus gonensis]KGP60814.1 DEAD/DEAH box helicase [Anoxybacillus gonensis]MDO0877202.1 SNF2-related protein [Anoxybacillus gonensis]